MRLHQIATIESESLSGRYRGCTSDTGLDLLLVDSCADAVAAFRRALERDSNVADGLLALKPVHVRGLLRP